ncbi:MAG: hypothetical protein BGN85_08935 [Alphaproteobacteria bacterium 64-11]|nr:MAG: hypothetical protein BGN85_08935 [Alphaproteobacteria bacterium 64-11]
MTEHDKLVEDVARGSAAAQDVLAERRRQVEVEGWTPEHDDEHANGELVEAAVVYARWAGRGAPAMTVMGAPFGWPHTWDASWWKPKDRRRDLVRAGALIIAEIERLDRLDAARIRALTGIEEERS